MKKILAAILSLVIILSLLGACNGSPSTSGVSTAPSASTAPTESTATVSSGPKEEVVFTWARQADMNTWNTFMGTDTNSNILNRFIYDVLVQSNDRKGSYQPGLATSWTSSEDGLTWTLELRKDVKFHNGDPFTSADVKYTFERFATDEKVRSMNNWKVLESVETPDDYTAIFHFKTVMATFVNALIDTYIVDSKYITEKGDEAAFAQPAGTGPWKFVSWEAGKQTVYERNDEYWGWGDQKSNVDKIVFKPILEDTTRLAAIQTGDIDFTEAINFEQAEQLKSVQGVKVQPLYTSALANFQFKIADSIFADPLVRQAASLAIDRQTIVETIAVGSKAQVWMATPADMGYKDVQPVYNPDKAKELLAQSSYKGEPFKIYAVTGQLPRSTEVLQAVSAMLNEVGFNSTVEFMESAALVAARTGGDYTCYVVSGAGSAGDPTPMLTQRWLFDIFKSGFKDDAMFELIKQAGAELDVQKRADLLTQIFQMSYDLVAPGMALYNIGSNYAYKENISGFKIFPDGANDYTRVMVN